MKLRTIAFWVCAAIMTAAIISAGEEKSAATPDSRASRSGQENKCLKIGVVSVRKIFQDCKRSVKYRREINTEGEKIEAELDKLQKELDLDKSSLKTLKPGTLDYTNLLQELYEKRGRYQAKQDYFKQLMDIRQQTILEQLFKDVIKATEEIAGEKGFDLVLEKSEPEMPNDFSTQKVLFSAGCEDITDAVLARVDANSP